MATKSATKKKKKVAKRKDPNKSKAAQAKKKNDAKRAAEKKEKGVSINQRVRELLAEKRFTDDQIFDKISNEFPDKPFKKGYICCKRWDLAKIGKNYPSLVKHEGKLIPKEKLPKKTKSRAKKYSEDNDPLKKVAGINVHKKKVKKSIKKKAKSAVKKRKLKV